MIKMMNTLLIMVECVLVNDQLLIISYLGRARCLGLMLRARLLNLSIAIA